MKKVEEILARPYRRVLVPDPEVGGYTALIDEFPGCIAEGDTADDALENLDRAAAAWIEAAEELGQQIPEPAAEEAYSGRIALRLPRSLHRRAADAARADNTSLNQFLVSAISERLGYKRATEQVLTANDGERNRGVAVART
ncbi:MAG: type II toxin-antitoxin system HicB family antitoxin [Acidobacteria bacterium]|nr:type II toxin-antitoxin system HicB family antitoxin [Acidobacteriota bacterium]